MNVDFDESKPSSKYIYLIEKDDVGQNSVEDVIREFENMCQEYVMLDDTKLFYSYFE